LELEFPHNLVFFEYPLLHPCVSDDLGILENGCNNLREFLKTLLGEGDIY
jgi:hypothetical protein